MPPALLAMPAQLVAIAQQIAQLTAQSILSRQETARARNAVALGAQDVIFPMCDDAGVLPPAGLFPNLLLGLTTMQLPQSTQLLQFYGLVAPAGNEPLVTRQIRAIGNHVGIRVGALP